LQSLEFSSTSNTGNGFTWPHKEGRYSLFQWQQNVLSSLSTIFPCFIYYSKLGSPKISSANAHICRRDDFCEFFGTKLFTSLFSYFESGPTGIMKKFAVLRLVAPGTPKKCTDCELRIDQNNLRICDWRTGTHKKFVGFTIADCAQKFAK
jgi:hypothetical protein